MVRPGIAVLLCLMLLPNPGLALDSSLRTLLQKDSLYQYLEVVEDTGKKERYILSGKSGFMQAGVLLGEPDKLLNEYTEMSFLGLAYLNRDPVNVLFIGLGAGVMPAYLQKHYPAVRIDVVEIDPEILSIARKYFHFSENERMKVHISDGRVFVKRTPMKYDLIFLDAYQSDYMPFHLLTVEFLREVKKKLNDNGVVVANILAPAVNQLFHSVLSTYRSEFPHVDAYTGRRTPNTVFIAVRGGIAPDQTRITQRARELGTSGRIDIDLPIYSSYKIILDRESDAKPLTDDFAPVNVYKDMRAGAR